MITAVNDGTYVGSDASTLETEMKQILEKAGKEKRSLTGQEKAQAEILKSNIAAIRDAETRRKMPPNTYYRSLATGGADVGNVGVSMEVVHRFNLLSPLFNAHLNVEKRGPKSSPRYVYSRITAGGSGARRAELEVSAADTESVVEMVTQEFKIYSGKKILVSREMIEDAEFDVPAEVMRLGMSKATAAWAVDAITALKSAFLVSTTFTPTETAATTWAIADLVSAYYEIPQRNRYEVKYTMNPATSLALATAVLIPENAQLLDLISLNRNSILEEDAMPDDLIFIGNPTLTLAIGMKTPVRTGLEEVSAGTYFEIQPRIAVGLRDATALSCRYRKQS